MNRNVISCLGVVLVESLVQGLHIVVHSGPCHAHYRHDADCVFVAHVQCGIDVQRNVFVRDRNSTHLDLPKLAELLPYDLVRRAHDKVRLVVRLSLGLATLAPSKPRRNASKHARL